jgi:hypothetical protein
LRELGAKDLAFQVIFNNCTAKASIRDERIHNKSDFLNYTVGYVVEPAIPLPIFNRSHIDYSKVETLNLVDFVPSNEDSGCLREVFVHFIATTMGRYCATRHITLPKLDFPMPTVNRLDPHQRYKVHVLPTYDLDENKMDDIIEILYRIGEDIGLKDSHIEHNIMAYGGDYFITVMERYLME